MNKHSGANCKTQMYQHYDSTIAMEAKELQSDMYFVLELGPLSHP